MVWQLCHACRSSKERLCQLLQTRQQDTPVTVCTGRTESSTEFSQSWFASEPVSFHITLSIRVPSSRIAGSTVDVGQRVPRNRSSSLDTPRFLLDALFWNVTLFKPRTIATGLASRPWPMTSSAAEASSSARATFLIGACSRIGPSYLDSRRGG